jgi:hypothetical protein
MISVQNNGFVIGIETDGLVKSFPKFGLWEITAREQDQNQDFSQEDQKLRTLQDQN